MISPSQHAKPTVRFPSFIHTPFHPRLTQETTAPVALRGVWSPTGSAVPEKLSTIQSWFQGCIAHHTECDAPTTAIGFVPRRLLDVSSHMCRLIDTMLTPPSDTRYAALSHCWGSDMPIRTLQENVQCYSDTIPHDDLPLTFRDAITIVRALGLRYLWIDSLCIVQDDPTDWEAEAAQMKDIYTTSVLVIAASDAADSSQGCLQPPVPAGQAPLALFAVQCDPSGSELAELVRVQKGHVFDETGRTVLSSRGWTFQEHALSRRTLHCMGAEMHWQCSECYETEPGVAFPKEAVKSAKSTGLERIWCNWMAQYSRRHFSFWADRLHALAGVVQHYQTMAGDRPILGLWERSFAMGLLWVRMAGIPGDQGLLAQNPSVPSWTWLSCPVAVGFDIWQSTLRFTPREVVEDHASIVRWNVTWNSTPFVSAVAATQLMLRGPIKEMLLEPMEATERPHTIVLTAGNEVLDQKGPRNTVLTCTGQLDTAGPRKAVARIKCLLVRSKTNIDSKVIREMFLMLEAETESQAIKQYRRIGIGCFIGNTPTFDWAVQDEVELV